MRTSVLMTTLASLLHCTPALRAPPTPGAAPLRHVLGVSEPRTFVSIDGVVLAVHDSAPPSDKPVLICLHAIGHGGGDFIGVESALADKWRVITVDWPSQGYSGTDAVPASAARYADLFGKLVDLLQLQSFVILGNSIGGAAAVRYASDHPTRVAALVLANPGGFDPGASGFFGKLYIGHLISRFERGARGEARFAEWYADYYDRILRTPAAMNRKAAIVAAGYETAPILVQAWESFRTDDAYLGARLSRLTMPVLITWAKQDALIQWSRNRETIEKIPHVEVAFFEAGHSPFLETPGAFLVALDQLLARLDRSLLRNRLK